MTPFIPEEGAFASSVKVPRVFYTGITPEAAQAYATKNGMQSIQMTKSGKVMQYIEPAVPKFLARPIWKKLSSDFAEGASNNSHYLYDKSIKTMKIDSKAAWKTTEFPILKRRGIEPKFVPIEP